jgi:hypothetical protein
VTWVVGRGWVGTDGGGVCSTPGDSLVYDAAGNPIWWKNTSTNGYDSLTWDG